MIKKSIKNKESTKKNHQQEWGTLKPMPYAQSFLSILKKIGSPNSRAKPSPIFCGTWSTGGNVDGLQVNFHRNKNAQSFMLGSVVWYLIFFIFKPTRKWAKTNKQATNPISFLLFASKRDSNSGLYEYSSKNETRGRISSLIKPKQPYFFLIFQNMRIWIHSPGKPWNYRPLEVFSVFIGMYYFGKQTWPAGKSSFTVSIFIQGIAFTFILQPGILLEYRFFWMLDDFT